MEDHDLQMLNEARRTRCAVISIKNLENGTSVLIKKDNTNFDPSFRVSVSKAFRTGKSCLLDDEKHFIAVYLPPPRLVIIGAVHISQALAPMAQVAGFNPLVIDPRSAFATPERFPTVKVHAQWPQDIPDTIALDAYTAVAALTHDPKIDDPALIAALESKCFYVGALGSRKTHAKRLARLREAGVSAARLDDINAPIGLPIHAATPAEIAVAILAELIARLRRPATANG